MQDYSIANQVLQIKRDLLPEGLSTNTYRAEKLLKCFENMNFDLESAAQYHYVTAGTVEPHQSSDQLNRTQ